MFRFSDFYLRKICGQTVSNHKWPIVYHVINLSTKFQFWDFPDADHPFPSYMDGLEAAWKIQCMGSSGAASKLLLSIPCTVSRDFHGPFDCHQIYGGVYAETVAANLLGEQFKKKSYTSLLISYLKYIFRKNLAKFQKNRENIIFCTSFLLRDTLWNANRRFSVRVTGASWGKISRNARLSDAG